MGAYLLRRVLIAIPVLVGISVAGFVALALTPGDPITLQINPATLLTMTPAQIEVIRHSMGLDGPIYLRYLRWLVGLLQGNLGVAVSTGYPVSFEVGARIGPTLYLMGTAVVLALLIGIPFGVISAVRQYSRLDYALTTFSLTMISTPTFVLGLIFIFIFGIWLHLLPVSGLSTLGASFSVMDRIGHLIMPATILGLAYAAPLMRYTRASMLEVLGSEYVTTARSKGLSARTVLVRHALRNALLPIITVLGLMLPDLIGGAIITEQVFNWPGMGQLAVTAAERKDPSLMMAVMMLVAIAVVASTLIADVAYAVADPRVRLASGR
ncbi:MAG TPA: ABC transporter permease [Candidatus Saccharimonadales bacterium]|nr:ABC transporter permease [Candidatus Saccharimonadales bacterium]